MKITCPHCEKTINAPDKLAGRVVNCPGCKGEMELPTLEELGLAVQQAAAQQAPAQQAPAQQPAAPAPSPAPGGAGGAEPSQEELAPAPEGEIDERADTRRDSRRGSQRRARSGGRRGGLDGEGAVRSYRRNMVILGILLLPFAILTGGFALLFLTAAGASALGAGAAGQVETGAEVVGGGLAILAGYLTIIGAVLGAIGLFELIMAICAFLKHNWVNWVIAILMSLEVITVAAGALQAGRPAGMAVAIIPLVFLLLAIFGIRNYGKLRAAGLDVSGNEIGAPRSRSRPGRSGKKPGDAGTERKGRSGGTIRRRTTGSRSRRRRR